MSLSTTLYATPSPELIEGAPQNQSVAHRQLITGSAVKRWGLTMGKNSCLCPRFQRGFSPTQLIGENYLTHNSPLFVPVLAPMPEPQ